MNKDYLAMMDEGELEAYAKVLGFTTAAAQTAADKAKLIEQKRGRRAELTVLGIAMSIPVKRAHDRRFIDAMNKEDRTTEELDGAFRFLLGDEQYESLMEAVTEDDGTQDDDALGYAYNKLLYSAELKTSRARRPRGTSPAPAQARLQGLLRLLLRRGRRRRGVRPREDAAGRVAHRGGPPPGAQLDAGAAIGGRHRRQRLRGGDRAVRRQGIGSPEGAPPAGRGRRRRRGRARGVGARPYREHRVGGGDGWLRSDARTC